MLDMSVTARLCFVCLGNICRSPTAAAVMQHLVDQSGLRNRIEIESAGTSGWHIGEPPDSRSVAEARRRGIPMTNHGQQFVSADFDRFDLVLAADYDNLAALTELAPAHIVRDKVRLLREFDPDSDGDLAVPDPYYGGENGFRDVFDLIEAACAGLLEELRAGPLAGT